MKIMYQALFLFLQISFLTNEETSAQVVVVQRGQTY